jgi:hypothetical protein
LKIYVLCFLLLISVGSSRGKTVADASQYPSHILK